MAILHFGELRRPKLELFVFDENSCDGKSAETCEGDVMDNNVACYLFDNILKRVDAIDKNLRNGKTSHALSLVSSLRGYIQGAADSIMTVELSDDSVVDETGWDN